MLKFNQSINSFVNLQVPIEEKERILIVDDEPFNIDSLKIIL